MKPIIRKISIGMAPRYAEFYSTRINPVAVIRVYHDIERHCDKDVEWTIGRAVTPIFLDAFQRSIREGINP